MITATVCPHCSSKVYLTANGSGYCLACQRPVNEQPADDPVERDVDETIALMLEDGIPASEIRREDVRAGVLLSISEGEAEAEAEAEAEEGSRMSRPRTYISRKGLRRRRQISIFLASYFNAHGTPPTFREMVVGVGLSRCALHHHLEKMCAEGSVKRLDPIPGGVRSYRCYMSVDWPSR